MKFHCYIEYLEDLYESDVEAETAEDAAVKAAIEHHVSGFWTVIPGVPEIVEILREERFFFEPTQLKE